LYQVLYIGTNQSSLHHIFATIYTKI